MFYFKLALGLLLVGTVPIAYEGLAERVFRLRCRLAGARRVRLTAPTGRLDLRHVVIRDPASGDLYRPLLRTTVFIPLEGSLDIDFVRTRKDPTWDDVIANVHLFERLGVAYEAIKALKGYRGSPRGFERIS